MQDECRHIENQIYDRDQEIARIMNELNYWKHRVEDKSRKLEDQEKDVNSVQSEQLEL